jgi:riboflavin kinase/FMN adenylyltransferase
LQVHRGSLGWDTASAPVVTIGNFDGVHVGHRALVARTLEVAAELGAPACVYTFDPAPVQVLRPDKAAPRVQTLDEKLHLLDRLGVPHTLVEPFDAGFAAQEPADFARGVLLERLGARALVLGWDFRFGRGRGGTVEGIREWLDIPVLQVDAVLHDGEPISSSRIRRVVAQGDLVSAAALLGRHHVLRGKVVHGDARGRTLGFPTANIAVRTQLLPPHGVYAVNVERNGRILSGVANLGLRPTFGPGTVGLEVHLLDWSGDLYGEDLAVSLVGRIRGERSFDSVESLTTQISKDVETARGILA